MSACACLLLVLIYFLVKAHVIKGSSAISVSPTDLVGPGIPSILYPDCSATIMGAKFDDFSPSAHAPTTVEQVESTYNNLSPFSFLPLCEWCCANTLCDPCFVHSQICKLSEEGLQSRQGGATCKACHICHACCSFQVLWAATQILQVRGWPLGWTYTILGGQAGVSGVHAVLGMGSGDLEESWSSIEESGEVGDEHGLGVVEEGGYAEEECGLGELEAFHSCAGLSAIALGKRWAMEEVEGLGGKKWVH